MTGCNLKSVESVDDSIRTSFSIINFISGFFAFFGNLLIITVILYRERLRTRPNYLICCLAVTDFIVGLIIQPMVGIRLILPPLWNNCMMADIVTYIGSVLCGASACILSVISYDRFLHIIKWQTYHVRMSKRKLSVLIGFCWIVPSIGSITSLFLPTRKIYYIALTAMALTVAVCIIICYKGIFSFLRGRRRVFQGNRVPGNPDNGELARLKKNSKVATSFAIIIGCFAVCWLPLTIFSIYVAVIDISGNASALLDRNLITIRYIAVTFGMSNSSINPLIYFWRNKALRVAAKEFLLTKIFRR